MINWQKRNKDENIIITTKNIFFEADKINSEYIDKEETMMIINKGMNVFLTPDQIINSEYIDKKETRMIT